MAKKLNSMRALDADGIAYEVLHFPDTIHSAQAVAEHFGLPAAQIYKTLVLLTSKKKPDPNHGASGPRTTPETPSSALRG